MSYLFAAFSVVWIAVFLYVLSLARRQRQLAREVEALRQMMEQKVSTTKSSQLSP
jgi:CcmD family protein